MLPHGSRLIDRVVASPKREEILKNIAEFKRLMLNEEQVKDVRNIARGVYSPLTGFLREDDFQKVVSEMRLSNGTVWPIPIVLDISEKDSQKIRKEKEVLLIDHQQKPVALLKDIQIYPYQKDLFAEGVFGTKDKNHPGVDDVYHM